MKPSNLISQLKWCWGTDLHSELVEISAPFGEAGVSVGWDGGVVGGGRGRRHRRGRLGRRVRRQFQAVEKTGRRPVNSPESSLLTIRHDLVTFLSVFGQTYLSRSSSTIINTSHDYHQPVLLTLQSGPVYNCDLYAFIGFIGPDDINYMCWTLSDNMCYILVMQY